MSTVKLDFLGPGSSELSTHQKALLLQPLIREKAKGQGTAHSRSLLQKQSFQKTAGTVSLRTDFRPGDPEGCKTLKHRTPRSSRRSVPAREGASCAHLPHRRPRAQHPRAERRLPWRRPLPPAELPTPCDLTPPATPQTFWALVLTPDPGAEDTASNSRSTSRTVH